MPAVVGCSLLVLVLYILSESLLTVCKSIRVYAFAGMACDDDDFKSVRAEKVFQDLVK